MTGFKLLTAAARLSVMIATPILAQIVEGHCAYASHHTSGNAGIYSSPMRPGEVAAIIPVSNATSGAASAPCATVGNETTTRPWSAPVGHCQPHAADIPSSNSEAAAQQFFDQENAMVDRKIQGVCRGC
jgi:hypothetical protein